MQGGSDKVGYVLDLVISNILEKKFCHQSSQNIPSTWNVYSVNNFLATHLSFCNVITSVAKHLCPNPILFYIHQMPKFTYSFTYNDIQSNLPSCPKSATLEQVSISPSFTAVCLQVTFGRTLPELLYEDKLTNASQAGTVQCVRIALYAPINFFL